MDIVERCTQYLSSGGLFNPELMDHDKVSRLILDSRKEVVRLRKALQWIADLHSHGPKHQSLFIARAALKGDE